jgi:hypothetical protein
MRGWATLLASTLLFLIFTATPASAQEKTASKHGFLLKPNSNKKILVFRPTVKMGSQSTGGMFEPNAAWTDEARKNLLNSLIARQAKLGNEVVFAPEPFGDDARRLEEHMALFEAVADSVIEYQFFKGNRLPTKKRDNKNDIFDWSLGKTVANLPGAGDADYGLFIFNEDQFGSTGRKLLQVVALLGPGISVKSGEHKGYAGLIDLATGDLLWLNADGAMGGDLRDPEGAEKRVSQLLEEFPGSDLRKIESN